MTDALFTVAEVCGCQKWNCPLCKVTTDKLARRSDPVTSRMAASKVNRATMIAKLTDVYRLGDFTAEEAAAKAGYSAADGAWKRVSDLIQSGVLVDTGNTRRGSSGRAQRVLRLGAGR